MTVQAGRVQLLPEEPELVLTRSSRLPYLFRGTQLPTDACLHLVCCHTRIEGDQLHLPIRVVEVEKRHIRDHQLRSTALQAQPAARSRDVTGTGHKIQALHEGALVQAQEVEDTPGVDRDLSCAATTWEPHPGTLVIPDHCRIEIAEAIHLGPAQEGDVDVPTLQIEAEQVRHRHHRGGAGHERGVADGERQPGWSSPVHPRLVYELQLRGNGEAGQVASYVGHTDPYEDRTNSRQSPRRRDDHHLGGRVAAVGHL